MPAIERTPRRRKEAPAYSVIERICHGIEVVEMGDGSRRYHVMYEHGTLDSPHPSHYFFNTIGMVLNNHERVIQGKLGTLHRLPSGDALSIAGDTQQMSSLAERIATLAGSHIALATYTESTMLKDQIAAVRVELGNVRNPYKVAAKQELGIAFVTPDPKLQLDALLAGSLDIFQKASEDLRIAQGALGRWRLVFEKRREWEGAIEKASGELGILLKRMREENLTANMREQEARHISGQPEGLLAQLNRITGPEYWVRIQDRDVQRLANFGQVLRAGNDQSARGMLEASILKLWRVVEERAKREKGEREK